MDVLTIQPTKVAKRIAFLIAVAGLVAVGFFRFGRPLPTPPALATATRIVAVAPAPGGVDWVQAAEVPEIAEALAGTDPDAVAAALRGADLEGVWVPATPDAGAGPERSVGERLSAGMVVRGFRGRYLSVRGILYVPEQTEWPEALGNEALGRVARQILDGGEPPPIDAYPEGLARRQPVEVLVLLRGPQGLRLWRSARAESIAEGLNTAALAARKRWEERSTSMGGALDERLAGLDVEVALLFDDGTFDPAATSLIDPFVQPAHGVAYEQPSRWRYLLPVTTHLQESPTAAYRLLFRQNDLPEESFERNDLRLYRFRMQTIAVDYGSTASSRADGLSASPADSAAPSGASESKVGSGSSEGRSTTNVVP